MSENPLPKSQRNATRSPSPSQPGSSLRSSLRKKLRGKRPPSKKTPPPPEDPQTNYRRCRNNFIALCSVAGIVFAGSIVMPAVSLASSLPELLTATTPSCSPRLARHNQTAIYVNSLVTDRPNELSHSSDDDPLNPEELDFADLPDSPVSKTLRHIAEITTTTNDDLSPGDVDFRKLLDNDSAQAAHTRLISNTVAILNGEYDHLLSTPPCEDSEDFRDVEDAFSQLANLRRHLTNDLERLIARKRFIEQSQWCTGNESLREKLRQQAGEGIHHAAQTQQTVSDTLDGKESVSISREDMAVLNTKPAALSATSESITQVLDALTEEGETSCRSYDKLASERDRLSSLEAELSSLTDNAENIVSNLTNITDRIAQQRQDDREKRQRAREAHEKAKQRRAEEAAKAKAAEEARLQQEREEAEEARLQQEREELESMERARQEMESSTTPEPRVTITTTVTPEEWEQMQQ